MADPAPSRAPASPAQFKEASDWFRAKKAVTRDEWKVMSIEARRQSFSVAGVQQLDVVQAVMESLQRAIDSGEGIDKWRAAIKDKLGKQFLDEHATTLTTSFITTNQIAYNTGRYYQLSEPSVTDALPYRLYDAILDSSTSDICRACAGTVLRHDDPWWQTHWCPCHMRCRSTIRAISARMAERRGVTTKIPAPKISGDFGLAPPLRATWEPDLNKYDANAAAVYEQKQQSMKQRQAAGERKPRKRPQTPASPTPVQPSTRLGDLGEKVFGRKISDGELDSLMGIKAQLPQGMTMTVHNVRESEKKQAVQVSAMIKDDKGTVVALLSREFTAGGNVKHATFFIEQEFQNLKIGRSVFNAQIDAYKASRLVKQVDLDAAEVGRYVWTKAGFQWNEDATKELLGHLKTKLKDSMSEAAVDRVMSKVKTAQDVARLNINGERVGKDLLINYPVDAYTTPMSQSVKKIKPL